VKEFYKGFRGGVVFWSNWEIKLIRIAEKKRRCRIMVKGS